MSPRGFDALRLSLWGAAHVFGPEAKLAVCVNTISPEEARERVGDAPDDVSWLAADDLLPAFLLPHLDEASERAAWRLAPVRVFPEDYELSLDNDCVLWSMPNAVRQWLEDDGSDRCLLGEDTSHNLGQYGSDCGWQDVSLGIRGLPPQRLYDHEAALRRILDGTAVTLHSGQDVQGLEAAAILSHGEPVVVRLSQVTLCSPQPPHLDFLGSSGAHFVGLNAKAASAAHGEDALTATYRHFDSLRPFIESRVFATTPTRAMLA